VNHPAAEITREPQESELPPPQSHGEANAEFIGGASFRWGIRQFAFHGNFAANQLAALAHHLQIKITGQAFLGHEL
jgi:hypothetical protein